MLNCKLIWNLGLGDAKCWPLQLQLILLLFCNLISVLPFMAPLHVLETWTKVWCWSPFFLLGTSMMMVSMFQNKLDVSYKLYCRKCDKWWNVFIMMWYFSCLRESTLNSCTKTCERLTYVPFPLFFRESIEHFLMFLVMKLMTLLRCKHPCSSSW